LSPTKIAILLKNHSTLDVDKTFLESRKAAENLSLESALKNE